MARADKLLTMPEGVSRPALMPDKPWPFAEATGLATRAFDRYGCERASRHPQHADGARGTFLRANEKMQRWLAAPEERVRQQRMHTDGSSQPLAGLFRSNDADLTSRLHGAANLTALALARDVQSRPLSRGAARRPTYARPARLPGSQRVIH